MAITKVTGALVDIGDLDLTNVGTLHLDSIVSDASPAAITIGYGPADTLTINGLTTMTTDGNGDTLTLTSTDTDSSFGPNLNFYRNSSNPADDDLLAQIDFNGRNDNTQDVLYANIQTQIIDASDGTEDGRFQINTIVNGTDRNRFLLTPTETVLNDNSIDLDFRVESNDSANMLFVDGGNNKVLIEAQNTATVSNAATMIAAGVLEINGNAGEGSDHIKMGAMADGTGDQFIEATNSGATSAYRLMINPVNGGKLYSGGHLEFPSGKGIDFSSATDSATGETTTSSVLDDYEEGTFTPVITTQGGDYTAGSQSPIGRYTKIGRLVYIEVEVSISSSTTISGGSGDFRITGMPFDPDVAAVGNCSTGRVDKPGYGTWQAYQPEAQTYVNLRAIADYPTDSDGIEVAQAAIIHGNATPWFSINLTYSVD